MNPSDKPQVLELLRDYPVIFSINVQWGDQDSFRHVNNTLYFRWCETARICYLKRIGLPEMYLNGGIGPILAAVGCNFRKPVTFPDTVHVGARVPKVGRSSFQMDHLVVSEALGVVADATSTLVVYDYDNARSHPIPDSVREAIRRTEAREPELPVR